MRKASLIVAGLVLVGCSAQAETAPPAAAPAPAPTPPPVEQPADPQNYGDDKTLDRLWDRCAADDVEACDDLYWDSPLGSDYERFALDRLDELESGQDVLNSRDTLRLLMDMVWLGMTPADRVEICFGVGLFGSDVAATIILSEMSGDYAVEDAAEWLDEACSD